MAAKKYTPSTGENDVQENGRPGWRLLLKLFFIFFRLGAFTIGGGMAMIPLIENEICVKHKLIPQDRIVDTFAMAQSAPGVIAINSATLVGYQVAGLRGAIVSSLGVILPSFGMILAIAILLVNFFDNVHVQNAFRGVRAGVTALIMLAAIKLGRRVLKHWFALAIFALAFTAITIFEITPILVILCGAIVGLIYNFIVVARKRGEGEK